MNKLAIYSAFFLSLPSFASAQSLQTFLPNLMTFLSVTVIPFLLGVAFLIFVVNAIRFFVISGSNEDGQERAKALATYSVAAFVLIVIFWGIINLLSSSIGLDNETAPVPDYIENAAYHNPTCDPGQTSVCSGTFGTTVCRCE